MIDQLTINKIKSVARTADVVGDFCELRNMGRELTCPCPLHGGKALNHFKVNPVKNIYHCFVCGKSGDAITFLMDYQGLSYPDAIRWLGSKYGIQVDEEQSKFTDVKPSKAVPVTYEPLPTLVLPLDIVRMRMDTTGDTLCNWVRELPWDDEQRARVEPMLKAYAVGHGNGGHTIFWQIDDQARVRSGKMMLYKTDGHRDKETRHNFDWIHSSLSRAGRFDLFDPEKSQFRSCLFGLHLVNTKVGNKTVNLVESEKSAIIMAIANGFGNGFWMATGGKQFLRRESIDILKAYGFKVIIHPDKDAVEDWRAKLRSLGFVENKDYLISNFYTDIYWREIDGPKADCADIIVRMMEGSKRAAVMESLTDVIRRHPTVRTLIDRLDLEPIKYTANET